MKRARKSLILAFALAVALGGGATFLFLSPRQPQQTAAVKMGDIAEAIYGLGTVTPSQTYQVKIAVSSNIRRLHVTEGEAVRKGRLLVELDEGGSFRAPFSGTVTLLPFKPGELVPPQMPIVTLMNLDDRYVVVSLEQESAMRVQPGQDARIGFESLRGHTFSGKVRWIYPGDGQFLVRIDFRELPAQVLPGMTGDVAISIERKEKVTLVPVNAVQMGHVIVKNGRKTKKVKVTIGAVDGRWAEVTSGALKPGDTVVVSQR
jgi:membrane fusion protein, macrolide-specific efflux system